MDILSSSREFAWFRDGLYRDFYRDLGDDLHIRVLTEGGGEALIVAHYDIVRLHSKLAQELPAPDTPLLKNDPGQNDTDAITWDLRGLVLESEAAPVTLSVVTSWLQYVYSRACGRSLYRVLLDGKPVNNDSTSASRSHGSAGTNADADADVRDLKRLKRLLRFADAVCTSPVVLDDVVGYATSGDDETAAALISNGLTVVIRCPPGSRGQQEETAAPTTAMFRLRGELYRHTHSAIQAYDADTAELVRTVRCGADAGDIARTVSALTAELEDCMYLAARMRLRALLALAMAFVQMNAPLCFAAYSARVVAALPRDVVVRGFLAQSLGGRYHADLALPGALGYGENRRA